MPPVKRERLYRWAIGAAILWYCVFAILFIAAKPGFHYDEALDVMASVSMLHSRAEMTLPHDPDTWTCLGSRCFPLMNVRYIGPIKAYLCLPLFKLFGPQAEIFRGVSAAMGALGLIGLAFLLARQVNFAAAAAVTWILAISPTYLDQTTFDNATLAGWMGAMGLLCFAGSAYLDRRTPWTAFLLGLTLGFGIWMRANYLWLLVPLAFAVLVAFGRKAILPIRDWLALIAGGIVGGLPFLVYQILSRGGTWAAVGMFPNAEPMAAQLKNRLIMTATMLISDAERRIQWNGPSIPDWQLWLFPTVVALSSLICFAANFLVREQRIRNACRIAAISFLGLASFLFLTRLQISEHHLTALLPLAAVVAVLAGYVLLCGRRWALPIVSAVALLYLSAGLYWQISALQGLRTSGGIGPWSDGLYELTNRLTADHTGQEVKILDWGLQSSVYVLSNARVKTREMYSDATVETTSTGRLWKDEIRDGGIYVLFSPKFRQIPAASNGFRQAVKETRPEMQVRIIPQRNGEPLAEIIEIKPNSFGSAPPSTSACNPIVASDLKCVGQLQGMHQIEQGGWRWTKQVFSLTFAVDAPNESTLVLRINVPEALIQSAGSVQMTIRLGEHVLKAEAFSKPGDYTITRPIETSWIQRGVNQFDVSLDKHITTPSDTRELGIIFVSAELRPAAR